MSAGPGTAVKGEPGSDGDAVMRGSNGVSNGREVDGGGTSDQNQGDMMSGEEPFVFVCNPFTLCVKYIVAIQFVMELA